MRPRSTDSAWEWFGRHDPYFGVLSHHHFRDAARAGQARAEFFESGERYIERILPTVHELAADFEPSRALDFGCGVGRLTLPLAKRAKAIVGVDVSTAMIDEARRNAAERGLTNAEWLVSDERLECLRGEFDFIHSFIVFQHIPVRRGLGALRTLLDHLGEGGVAVLHVTYRDRNPAWRRTLRRLRRRIPALHRALERMRGRPDQPLMEMNSYPLEEVFAALQERGCHRIAVRFSDHGGHWGLLLFARRSREVSF